MKEIAALMQPSLPCFPFDNQEGSGLNRLYFESNIYDPDSIPTVSYPQNAIPMHINPTNITLPITSGVIETPFLGLNFHVITYRLQHRTTQEERILIVYRSVSRGRSKRWSPYARIDCNPLTRRKQYRQFDEDSFTAIHQIVQGSHPLWRLTHHPSVEAG